MPWLVVAKCLFVLVLVVVVLAPLMTWVERKQSALMQDRIGANRAAVGGVTLIGLFHPLADMLKLLTKEDVVPDGANRVLHALAPMIAAIPAIAAFAVIPFGGV
jgi:NADH-quinone oxidoreductase subunit H